MSDIEDELFLMTNLYPATTGLPMVIWVSPRYGPAGQARGLKAHQHDVRVKVMPVHGTRMDPGNLAVVAVRPPERQSKGPHVVAGQLSSADLQAVSRWIALNEAAILDHRNGLTDGVQMGRQLRPLSPPIPP